MELDDEVAVIRQEGQLVADVPPVILEILARYTRALRQSPAINQTSGVSARFAIAGAETVAAAALRRASMRGEAEAVARIVDLDTAPDGDIGPMLQVQKLATSVRFARVYGKTEPLTAAELELMNLTGDGNGIDMVLMPPALRQQVPTANFFQPLGYSRNPIASRSKTVSGLIDAIQDHMNRGTQSPGARELAAAF